MTTPDGTIDNVRVAVGGKVWKAPLGTLAPTTATATVTGYTNLGYLSEDGFTEADDVDTEEITAWQNGTLVRRVITSQAKTFEFVCIESTPAVMELRHPGSTVAGGALAVKALKSGIYFALVFDVIDGATHLRIVAPKCEVTDFEDIEYQNGEAIGYGVTVTVYPDADGVVIYKYSDAWV